MGESETKLWRFFSLKRYEELWDNPPREPSLAQAARVPLCECGEPLVDLRRLGGRFCLRAPLPWLREAAARMLVRAARLLPPGYALSVNTCFRTIEAQRAGYERYRAHLRKLYPHWPESVVAREAARWFHPPHSPVPPGHCTGGAVDVCIVSPRGRMVYMGGTWRDGPALWRTFSREISEQARRNRAALFELMSAVGFSNCYDEWWHWSYGDALWACRTGARCAIYGLAHDLPEELAREAARRRARRPRLLRWRGRRRS